MINDVVQTAIQPLQNISIGVKNAFDSFVYTADGKVTNAFQTLIAWLMIVVGFSVVVTLFNSFYMLIKRGDKI